MRLYVAGPMAGLPEFNYPLFRAVAADLRQRGYDVENPADNVPPVPDGTAAQWHDYMRVALAQMLTCEGVALLSGWQRSRGASLEVYVATQCQLTVMPVADWLLAGAR